MKLRLVYYLNDNRFEEGCICRNLDEILEYMDIVNGSKREQRFVELCHEAVKQWFQIPHKHGDRFNRTYFSIIAFECPEFLVKDCV